MLALENTRNDKNLPVVVYCDDKWKQIQRFEDEFGSEFYIHPARNKNVGSIPVPD